MPIQTKLCKHCKSEINKEASKCPKCGGKNYVWTTGKKVAAGVIIVGIFFWIIILASAGSSGSPSSAPVTQPVAKAQTSPADIAAAQKDFNETMALAKKAGLVTSYEFSDTAHIVYIGPIWYTQTVAFKKDFLAKISMTQAKINGKGFDWEWFTVNDAYSNEKVAEVTAFSGSLEVYK